MDALSLQDPLFATYVIAAALMIFKAVSMSWLTVVRMMQVKGGFRSPEDLRKTAFNPEPRPEQLAPDDRVDRVRRIQLNDLESLPYFLVAAFLFVLARPPLLLAQVLLRWGIQHLRSRGAGDVVLVVEGRNANALRLYERTGFVQQQEWPRWARPDGGSSRQL